MDTLGNTRRIGGRYELVERLATGGFGEVWFGRDHEADGREVAVKLVSGTYEESSEVAQMFLDEARILARLDHPGCVRVYDLGLEGSRLYLVMEFLRGQDLRYLLKTCAKHGMRIPTPLVVEIVARVAAALHYAHELTDREGRWVGLVHRDVSPHNVMVGFDGSVKLLDFGIAKLTTEAGRTEPGVLKGKYAYMSPEQVRGLELDRRVDVFGLGVVLYEASIGRRLFKGETDHDTLRRVAECNIIAPRVWVPDYSPDLERIVLRALKKVADERYPTAAAMEAELRDHLARIRDRVTDAEISDFMLDLFEGREMTVRDRVPIDSVDNALPPTARPTEPYMPAARSTVTLSEAEDPRDRPPARRWKTVGMGAVAGAAIAGLAVLAWPSGTSDPGRGEGAGAWGAPGGTAEEPSVEELLGRADAALAGGRWVEAAREFDRVLVSNPKHTGAFVGREQARSEARAQRAVEDLRAAVAEREWQSAMVAADRVPKSSRYHREADALREAVVASYLRQLLASARASVEDGDLELASMDLAVVRRLDPSNAEAARLERSMRRRPRRSGTAGVASRPGTGDSGAPNPGEAALLTGLALIDSGAEKRAIAFLERALEIDPEGQADAHRFLGTLYTRTERPDLAAHHLQAYLRKRPDAPDRAQVENVLAALP